MPGRGTQGSTQIRYEAGVGGNVGKSFDRSFRGKEWVRQGKEV